MRRVYGLLAFIASTVGLLAFAPTAGAGHDTDPRSKLRPLGHIVEPAVLGGFGGANPDIHTDIAFWGRHAFQGNWDGFNIRDISNSRNPTQVSRTFCDGNQGDLVVWRDVLVRSWNTPAGTAGPFGAGLTCDGQAVAAGFEGVHVFDISNLEDPVLVASVPLACGSHTVTAVPDRANNRLLVYSSSSAHDVTEPINPNPPETCDWFDIVEVPLDDPAQAELLRTEPSVHTCHDIGVILGNERKAACAGGEGVRVYSLGGQRGGSRDNPRLLYSIEEEGVTGGHSAAFTWDGETIIFGHEPGGGVAAECEATDPEINKTVFFYDSDDGEKLGQWTLPRPQSATENCTLHNYNTVPLRRRDILVMGNYQAGTWVVDFTNPANARTVAWSDPPPAPVPAGTPFCCDVTGAWSSYWYNDRIYETNIGEGLNIFRLRSDVADDARRLDHLNPQTQEFTIG
jgi:hypothetical protein